MLGKTLTSLSSEFDTSLSMINSPKKDSVHLPDIKEVRVKFDLSIMDLLQRVNQKILIEAVTKAWKPKISIQMKIDDDLPQVLFSKPEVETI